MARGELSCTIEDVNWNNAYRVIASNFNILFLSFSQNVRIFANRK